VIAVGLHLPFRWIAMKFRQYLIVCWHGCVACLTFVQGQKRLRQVQDRILPETG